jgi:PAS domain S-box-containing protein
MDSIDSKAILEQVEEGFFDQLPVMILTTRPSGGPGKGGKPLVEDCNERFSDRLGFSRSDVVGRPVADFYTRESAAKMRNGELERARSGKLERSTRELIGASGGVIDAVLRVIPRRENDAVVGTVAVYVDVTERRHRKEHVQALNRVMRHNVRNDVNVLAGHAEMLAERNADATESVEAIRRIVDRWTSLTEKARDIEAAFDVPVRRVPVQEVIRGTQTAVELANPGATVRTEFGVKRDLSVPNYVRSAVEELCENGVKHADVPDPSVTLRAERGDREGWISISVADQGPGLPEHERRIITQGEETPLVHGSGLGFWLVRMVVRRIEGHIEVGDRDPTGTVVTLHVPVASCRTDVPR